MVYGKDNDSWHAVHSIWLIKHIGGSRDATEDIFKDLMKASELRGSHTEKHMNDHTFKIVFQKPMNKYAVVKWVKTKCKKKHHAKLGFQSIPTEGARKKEEAGAASQPSALSQEISQPSATLIMKFLSSEDNQQAAAAYHGLSAVAEATWTAAQCLGKGSYSDVRLQGTNLLRDRVQNIQI